MKFDGSKEGRAVLRAVVVGVVVIVSSVGLGCGAAFAFPLRGAQCDAVQDFNYGWGDGPWTSTKKSWFTGAAAKWDSMKNAYGGNFTSSGSGGSIEVHLLPLSGTTLGLTNCDAAGNLHSITIDPDKASSQRKFQFVAMHEVGHAHGLGHTGVNDSWDGETAAMYCFDDGQPLTLRQDDYEQAANIFDPSSVDTLTANDSFEHGNASFWGTSNVSSSSVLDGGVDGSYYLRFKGSGSSVFQSSRLTDPTDVDARFNYKKWSTTDYGYVQLNLQKLAKLDYGGGGSNPCSYITASGTWWNLDNPTKTTYSGVNRTVSTITEFPSTSWESSTTAEWTGVDSWEGADIRVVVYNYMYISSSGAPAYVRIDHVRAREK